MVFFYKGFDANGKSVSARIEAESKEKALEKIDSLQIYVEKIKEVKSGDLFSSVRDFFHHRYNKVPVSELSALSKELSVYLRSGMNLTQALTLLKEQQDRTKVSQFITQVHNLMIEGDSFSGALGRQNIYYVPDFYVKTIEASENSGNLEKVLDQLSSLLRDNQRMENEVQNALIYPLFMLTMSFFIIIFLINYVIPKISEIFMQMNQELPVGTRIIIAMGDFMQAWGGYIFAVILVLVIGALAAIKANVHLQKKVDRNILKIPLVGKLIFVSDIARFSVIASNLLSAGMPFVQAIVLASQTFKNKAIAEVFQKVSKQIVEGKSFAKSLQKSDDIKIPKSFIHTVSIGESSGNLPEMMTNIAELYTYELRDKKDKFLAMLEPAIILFMGGLVGFIVVSMLLPIFNINFQ